MIADRCFRYLGMAAPARLRVMIAEDHEDVLKAMIRVLGRKFDIIGTAKNGRDLVDKAVLLHPDVIVSDILMPHFSGLQAMQELTARGCGIPFLFVSSSPELIEPGTCSIIDKIDAASELVPAVEAVASGKRYISRRLRLQGRGE
jgi:DNA-binding NarL/FixJ family response regulator